MAEPPAGAALADVIAPDDPRTGTGYWRGSAARLSRNKIGLTSAAVLVLLVIIALAAPLLSRFDPTQTDLAHTFTGPSGRHWLGTDELGRDTFARLTYGARVSLGVSFLTVTLLLLAGSTVGLVAGYYGGWLDQLLMRFADAVLAFPDVFLFMLMAVLLRPSPVALAFIVAIVGWADVSRLIRAEVLVLRNQDFVLAVRSLGAGDVRMVLGHILRNALPVIIVTASLRIGQVILIEAALDFLGLGVQPPTPSWGNMMSNAQNYFYHSAWLVILPGVAIFVAVVATNLLGNALRDALDPRLRNVG